MSGRKHILICERLCRHIRVRLGLVPRSMRIEDCCLYQSIENSIPFIDIADIFDTERCHVTRLSPTSNTWDRKQGCFCTYLRLRHGQLLHRHLPRRLVPSLLRSPSLLRVAFAPPLWRPRRACSTRHKLLFFSAFLEKYFRLRIKNANVRTVDRIHVDCLSEILCNHISCSGPSVPSVKYTHTSADFGAFHRLKRLCP